MLNKHGPNEGELKLSDVFTLYYKGETALRPEINLPTNPSYSLYTSNGSESVEVVLRHEPNKGAAGVAEGDMENAGGESDIDVTFNLQVD